MPSNTLRWGYKKRTVGRSWTSYWVYRYYGCAKITWRQSCWDAKTWENNSHLCCQKIRIVVYFSHSFLSASMKFVRRWRIFPWMWCQLKFQCKWGHYLVAQQLFTTPVGSRNSKHPTKLWIFVISVGSRRWRMGGLPMNSLLLSQDRMRDEDELQKLVAGISKVYEKLLRPTGRPWSLDHIISKSIGIWRWYKSEWVL